VGGSETAKPCLSPGTASIKGAILVPLGDLMPSSRGSVRLPVRFFGTSDRPPVAVTADLLYWEPGWAHLSRTADTQSWSTNESALKMSAVWPSKTIRGRETYLTVKYENAGGETLGDVRVKVEVPSGFTVTGASLARDGDGEFRLVDLAAGASGKVTVYGRFGHDVSAASPFTVTARLITEEHTGAIAVLHARADASAADLQVSAEVTSPAGTTGLEPGATVKYVVHYANTGDQPVQHAAFWLDEAALAGLVSDLSPAAGRWDEATQPELATIAPGASGELSGSFVVRPDALDRAERLSLNVSGQGLLADDAVRPVVIAAAPLEFSLTASTRLTAHAAYYTPDGDQLGVGPLPPRVGEATQYWISLKPEAIGKSVKDAAVTAKLPLGVTWTGRASATAGLAPEYDQATRRLHWNLGELEPSTQAVASFEVSLTPSQQDVGQVMKLLTDIRLSARDVATEIGLDKTADGLDTNLVGDLRAAGLGQVAPAIAPAKVPKAPKTKK
jgi:hypothetical protein